jgi:hypothetical protein
VSELTWYSRFAVWVGAVVLLAQAIAGRGAGVMSAFAVLILAVGFVVFLSSLGLAGRRVRVGLDEVGRDGAPESAVTEEPSVDRGATVGEEVAGKMVAATEAEPNEGETAGAGHVHTAVERTETVAETVAPSPPRVAGVLPARVRTHEVGSDSTVLEVYCVHCTRRFSTGQVLVICPICGAPQHAGCWIENRFRCSTPGCSGRGSLEAPESVDGESAEV